MPPELLAEAEAEAIKGTHPPTRASSKATLYYETSLPFEAAVAVATDKVIVNASQPSSRVLALDKA